MGLLQSCSKPYIYHHICLAYLLVDIVTSHIAQGCWSPSVQSKLVSGCLITCTSQQSCALGEQVRFLMFPPGKLCCQKHGLWTGLDWYRTLPDSMNPQIELHWTSISHKVSDSCWIEFNSMVFVIWVHCSIQDFGIFTELAVIWWHYINMMLICWVVDNGR